MCISHFITSENVFICHKCKETFIITNTIKIPETIKFKVEKKYSISIYLVTAKKNFIGWIWSSEYNDITINCFLQIVKQDECVKYYLSNGYYITQEEKKYSLETKLSSLKLYDTNPYVIVLRLTRN